MSDKNNSVKVIGITIGPILETIMMAKSPAMLWYASTAFSRLAFMLCKEIEKIPQSQILVPYIDKKVVTPASDGVGKYHDRIIAEVEVSDDADFVSSEKLDDELKTIATNCKKAFDEMVYADLSAAENRDTPLNENESESLQSHCNDFFKNYIQIHYVIVDKDKMTNPNPILALSGALDALEQMKTFNPDNTNNPIMKLFGAKNNRNYTIKKSVMLSEVEKSNRHLIVAEGKNKGNFRDIADIAGRPQEGKGSKPLTYYAVINADGDSMGDYLKSLAKKSKSDDESDSDKAEVPINDKLIIFSKKCIEYASAVSQAVHDFGGMTIYAGGDDLLALAPVVSHDGKTIFDLCEEINSCFNKTVDRIDGKPTVSMGVAIRHIKFPLREAQDAARSALEGAAKKVCDKNSIAVDFQKHSGQSIKMCIPAEKLGFVKEMLAKSVDMDTVNSVIYILETYKGLFPNADEMANAKIGLEAMLQNIFDNLYDNVSQNKYKSYVKDLARKLSQMMSVENKGDNIENENNEKNEGDKVKQNKAKRKIELYDYKSDEDKTDLKVFEGLLRIKKFLTQEVYNDDGR